MRSKDKIVSTEKAIQQVAVWKQDGKKVVFTNGCFDLLHVGHIDYLEKAKALGDYLVIALNTDASVQRLKGELRPIVTENNRARVMAALGFVDLVVFFDQDTPHELISQLIPSILVKGSDYAIENIIGADVVLANGGEVKTIDFVEGFSSSNIIDKIKQA